MFTLKQPHVPVTTHSSSKLVTEIPWKWSWKAIKGLNWSDQQKHQEWRRELRITDQTKQTQMHSCIIHICSSECMLKCIYSSEFTLKKIGDCTNQSLPVKTFGNNGAKTTGCQVFFLSTLEQIPQCYVGTSLINIHPKECMKIHAYFRRNQ